MWEIVKTYTGFKFLVTFPCLSKGPIYSSSVFTCLCFYSCISTTVFVCISSENYKITTALGNRTSTLREKKMTMYLLTLWQKKHLELAKDTNDLVEQQRASTQLGRTYHEMFIRSEDDHCSIRNAKKYFKSAMKLAQTLKENPPIHNCSFLKEYIDAHNNIGMLEIDLDNFEEAQKILTRGLQICNEEEVMEDDDGRSRLHHNLGNVYMELRMWDKAREHIEKDILICKRIEHCQGEAKGYINLGELHNRVQKYDEALRCYQRALDLAKSMEDEDALVRQIDQNIKVVKEAINVMGDLKNKEQNFKKLTRDMSIARGTPRERKCLLQQNASLDNLIEKARMLSTWMKVYFWIIHVFYTFFTFLNFFIGAHQSKLLAW